jgi:hypothetical protein
MKKLIPLLILFSACSKEDIIVPVVEKKTTLSIDSVLTRNGVQSLPKDANGFYHLTLDRTSLNQQSHRVTGRILINGKEPTPAQKIDWESNLFWTLRKGDTVALITKTYINYYTGQYTIIKLPPLISSVTELVPTTNIASYSGTGGEVNTIISPTKDMRGDTLVLKANHTLSKTIIYTKIVLQ